MKSSSILTALVLAAGIGFGASTFAQPSGKSATTTAQPGAEHGKKHDGMKDDKKTESRGVKVGDVAPAFSLTDTDGKTVTLESLKGKIVVLEWFNPECPYIVKHHSLNHTFNDLYEQYNTKNVAFLAINSTAKGKEGNGKEVNAAKKTEFKLQYPILLDESGDVGHAYGATNTPHCFVIGADGKIAYMGAIDNSTDPKKAGEKNFVKMALDNVLAGKAAEPATTKPYGCGVKYAK
jgi:peroxiredoxin